MPGRKSLIVVQFLLSVSLSALIASIAAYGQCASVPADSPTNSEIQQRFNDKDWDGVVRLAESLAARSADANFAYGMALAHIERWQDARTALLAGHRQCPERSALPSSWLASHLS